MAAFDLFGLKKGVPTEEAAPKALEAALPRDSARSPVPAPRPRAPGLSPRAWVLLAALDGALVLSCAGVVAWRWQALKAVPPPPAPAKPAPKPAPEPPKETAKDEPKPAAPKASEAALPRDSARSEPAKPEAKKPEPAKPEPKAEAKKPEAKKPEPKTEAKKPVPLGRPSVLATPPAARSAAPKDAKAAAKPATRPVPFSYSDPDAKEVYLAGPFLVRSGGRKMMFKDSKGVWATTVYLNAGQTYRYRFEVVDAKGAKKLTAAQQVEVLPAD